jgi:phosphopantothenoylcysteine synthetase/decarboxylase
MNRVLYVIACGAPPARQVTRLIEPAQKAGWDVCVLVTPSATRFIDLLGLEKLTGHPVRSEYKEPGTSDVLPPPDAIIVAPATLNTINKWAAGICDTLALGILVEAIGKQLPVIAMPFTNYAHAAHPAFVENIKRLRSWGVEVLYGPDVYPLHAPGSGSQHLDMFPWQLTLESLERLRPRTEQFREPPGKTGT